MCVAQWEPLEGRCMFAAGVLGTAFALDYASVTAQTVDRADERAIARCRDIFQFDGLWSNLTARESRPVISARIFGGN
jgi:hypothetical protein